MLRYFCGYFIKEKRIKLLTLLQSRTIFSERSCISAFVFSIVFCLLWNILLVIRLLIVPIAIIAMSNTWTLFVIFIVIIRRIVILWSLPFSQSCLPISWWKSSSRRRITVKMRLLCSCRLMYVLRLPMEHYFGQNMKKSIWFKMINFI